MPNRPNFLKFSASQDRDWFAALVETISRMHPIRDYLKAPGLYLLHYTSILDTTKKHRIFWVSKTETGSRRARFHPPSHPRLGVTRDFLKARFLTSCNTKIYWILLKSIEKMPKNPKKWVKNCGCPPPAPPPSFFKKSPAVARDFLKAVFLYSLRNYT